MGVCIDITDGHVLTNVLEQCTENSICICGDRAFAQLNTSDYEIVTVVGCETSDDCIMGEEACSSIDNSRPPPNFMGQCMPYSTCICSSYAITSTVTSTATNTTTTNTK